MNEAVRIDTDDIETGLEHLSTLASELHDELQINQLPEFATKLERMAFALWVLKNLTHNIYTEKSDTE
jgi:hypothetical protein